MVFFRYRCGDDGFNSDNDICIHEGVLDEKAARVNQCYSRIRPRRVVNRVEIWHSDRSIPTSRSRGSGKNARLSTHGYFLNTMRIVILRHGLPDLPAEMKIRACELRQWIDIYNSAGVNKKQTVSGQSIAIAASCNVVVCSNLPRSIQSAETLGVKHIEFSDSLFREMDLPHANWNSPRFSPYTWTAFFRLLWFLGYSANVESFHSSKIRAIAGARKLAQIAEQRESVLFIGHGLINYFIAKELLSNGWRVLFSELIRPNLPDYNNPFTFVRPL